MAESVSIHVSRGTSLEIQGLGSSSLVEIYDSLPIKNSTKTQHRSSIKHLQNWLESSNIKPFELNASHLEAYFQSLKTSVLKNKKGEERSGYSISAQNARKLAIKTLLGHIFPHEPEKGRLGAFFDDFKPTKIKRRITKDNYLTEEEIMTLRDHFLSHRRSHTKTRTGYLIQALFETGCRIDEIQNLRWVDLDFKENHVVASVTGKGNTQRQVFMRRSLVDNIIKKLGKPSPWVFCTTQGNKINKSNSIQVIKNGASKVFEGDSSWIGHHTFRHSCAMHQLHVLKNDAKTVSEYLGHESITTTIKYYLHSVVTPEKILGEVDPS